MAHITPEITQIYRNQNDAVARFDWTATNYLGLCTVMQRQPFPMSQLVLPGSVAKYDTCLLYLTLSSLSLSARAFFLDGRKFEWRRMREDAGSYDVSVLDTPISTSSYPNSPVSSYTPPKTAGSPRFDASTSRHPSDPHTATCNTPSYSQTFFWKHFLRYA